ncbi:MAG: hypothetical protein AB7F09_06110 [Parvibaculaceae bacterium]
MWQRCVLAAFLVCAAVPAWAQEREWIFDTADEDAYLVFGVPESEDAGISFGCVLQSGEIRVFVPDAGDDLKPDQKIELAISAAGKTFVYAGLTTPNEMAATTSAEAAIPAGDPLFKTLRETDRFTVKTGTEENTFPLEGSDFESLVRACSKS